MMRLDRVMVVLVALLGAVEVRAGGLVHIVIGRIPAQVELATTNAELQHGLMGRTSLAPDGGMLFVLPPQALRCVWMKDTPLPLSAAFLGANGTIRQIVDMKPMTLDFHCGPRTSRFVLEMGYGWFTRHGVNIGMRVGLEEVRSGVP